MLKNGSIFSDSRVVPSVRCSLAQREISWAAMMKVRDCWPFKVQATGNPHSRPPATGNSSAEPTGSSFVT